MVHLSKCTVVFWYYQRSCFIKYKTTQTKATETNK